MLPQLKRSLQYNKTLLDTMGRCHQCLEYRILFQNSVQQNN